MRNKISIVVAIILISFGLYALMIQFSGQNTDKGQTSTASPTPFPTLRPEAGELKKEVTRSSKVSGDLNLQTGAEFEVIYLISNDQFLVRINQAPYSQSKKQAEKWFADKGFSPTDLCQLNITFVASREVSEAMSASDLLPSGCPPLD